MTVCVIANTAKDAALLYKQEVSHFLQERAVNVLFEPSADADFWVVLGGDGTMLRTSHQAVIFQIPMLGINFGNIGFLTDVDKQEGLQALEKVLQGKYYKEKRLMLEMETDLPLADRLALNDVYLSRGGFEKLIPMDVYINGQYMDNLRADGVLIATPTGSTAYNLSAGGPILMPDGDMMVITPVCPHNLHSRPWVITARDEVSIITHRAADVAIDGETRMELPANQKLTVRSSGYTTTILKTSELHFYEVLRRKMSH
jgi:NAD+ kinase